MNRIILIGNGFDLAHGLKTSYNHFIKDFWEQQCEEANDYRGWTVEDNAYVFTNNFYKLKKSAKHKKYKNISSLKDDIVCYYNNFLERIEKVRAIVNWVDLEELYYRELLNCLKIEKGNNDAFVISPIKKLNEDFADIRRKLNDYLKEIKTEITEEIKIPEIEEHIRKGLNHELLFLSFNYTDTERLYKREKDKEIHIHGEIDLDKNPMIFGYGDELASDFKDIENTNRNEFLENTKSIKYLDTRKYDELMDFINGDTYEVFIFGHSCGNSDRTLLNTIFEHDNCKKIIPFYHIESRIKDNFSEIIRNISRNFTREKDSKDKLRDKVEKKENCKPLYTKIIMNLYEFLETYFKEYLVEIDGHGVEYKLINNDNKSQVLHKYKIGKFQVTQELYTQIMGFENPSNFKGDRLPVECVSWYDCLEFCNALSLEYKLEPYYKYTGVKAIKRNPNDFINKNANGFRLPTEAEWEFAAIGGKGKLEKSLEKLKIKNEYNNLTEDEYKKFRQKMIDLYAGCDTDGDLNSYAWYIENSEDTTHDVGTKKTNELGMYDMSGNVWEWCEDTEGSFRVIRGGGWGSDAGYLRVSARGNGTPINQRSYDIGFRLVCSSKEN